MQRKTGLVAVVVFGLGVAGSSAGAATLLSTDFATPTSIDAIPYVDALNGADNGNKTVGWIGGNWTIGDNTLVDLKQVTSVVFGDFTWGSTGDTIKSGELWGTLGGGDHIDGNSSQLRHTGSSIQFNSSAVGGSALAAEPDGSAIFNLVLEVKPGDGIRNLQLSFRTGTAQTSGAWDNNTAAGNGNYNVKIVDASNTASGFSFYSTNQAIGAGAGPVVNAVDQTSATLLPGTYVMQVILTGKTSGQRYTIDDFGFAAEAVPEPGIAGMAAMAVLGLLARRRR